jgi:hypothetical protein
MLGSTIVATTIGNHLNGTYLPVEEPSTASGAEVGRSVGNKRREPPTAEADLTQQGLRASTMVIARKSLPSRLISLWLARLQFLIY